MKTNNTILTEVKFDEELDPKYLKENIVVTQILNDEFLTQICIKEIEGERAYIIPPIYDIQNKLFIYDEEAIQRISLYDGWKLISVINF